MLSPLHRLVFLVLSSLVPLLQTNIIKASDTFDESVGVFFESHCNRCHDDKSKKVISDLMNFPGTSPKEKTVNYGLK